ncbi:MAG: type II secretion system F family protein [Chloroflexi bacterium]|nr:type II secretion system F family protein [Chloroflexota bacterium]
MARVTQDARLPKLNFKFVAVGSGGRIVRGNIKAISEVDAQNLLVERGRTPVSIEEAPSFWSVEQQLPGFYKVKKREIAVFSRQLATLLDSGLSLLPAIQLLRSQSGSSRGFGRVLDTVAKDLNAGEFLSATFAKHPKVFDEIFIRTVAVGESTGNLQSVLRDMADHMESQEAFAKKIKGALTYPIIVITIGVIVAFVLLTVALPPLVDMFRSVGTGLPIPTRMLMAMSAFVNGYKLYMLAFVVIFIPSIVLYARKPSGRRMIDRLKMNIPVIGPAVQMGELARIARTMSMLLASGLPLQEIMEIIPRTTTNSIVFDATDAVRQGLVLGQGLSGPMAAQPIFPPLFLQMVRVGEETNALEANMRVVADFYETNATERTEAVVGMIAPLSTIFLAAMAGFIALAVIMPMYSITGSF